MGLKAEVGLEVLRYLANQTLEWKFADQQLGTLLILADFTERNSAGPEKSAFICQNQTKKLKIKPKTENLEHTKGQT